MHHCSEPPLSKTIVLARMGKEDVEGEGVGGEVYATLGRGSGRSDLRFSRWFWFSSSRRKSLDTPGQPTTTSTPATQGG